MGDDGAATGPGARPPAAAVPTALEPTALEPAALVPGEPVEVAPGVVRLLAPNPGRMTGPGTNTYLVGGDRLAVVDPGPDDDAHLARLLELFADRIGWIVVTHTHIDHSPLSRRLKEATGAEVIAFGPAPVPVPAAGAPVPAPAPVPAAAPAPVPAARSGAGDRGHGPTGVDPHDTGFVPDRRFTDGDRLDLPDCSLDAVWTPGHASNHLCLELAGTGLLFSGDHVMSGSTVVIAPPDGDMAVYMESLEKVRARRPRRIAPGHGAMIEDPGAVLDGYLRHRLEREAQVAALLPAAGTDGITTSDVVTALYREVPEDLHPVARYTVWAHLRKLAAEGRAATPDADDVASPWTVAAAPEPANNRKMRKA